MPAPARPTLIKKNTPFRTWRDQFNAEVELWNYFVNISGNFIATKARLTNPQITQGTLTNVTVANSSLSGVPLTNTRFTNPTISGGTQFLTTMSGVTLRDSTIDGGILEAPAINEPTISGGSWIGQFNLATADFSGGTISGAAIEDTIFQGANILQNNILSSPTMLGGTMNGVTVSGGTLRDNAINNPTVSGGKLQSNTFNKAAFADLPTAPTTTPTLSGHLVTKSYIDSIIPSTVIGNTASDATIPANRAVGVTASGIVTTAGLKAPSSLTELVNANVTSPDLSSGQFKVVEINEDGDRINFAFIWSDVTANAIRMVAFSQVNDTLTFIDDTTLPTTFGLLFDAGPVRDVSLDRDGFTIFGINQSTNKVAQRWYRLVLGSFATMSAERQIPKTYSSLGTLTMIQRNIEYPNITGVIYNEGSDTFLYSSGIDNGSTSTWPPQSIGSVTGSGFSVADQERLRFMRRSDDNGRLHLYFPSDEANAMCQFVVNAPNAQTVSGVGNALSWRLSYDPNTITTWGRVGIKDQWAVGNMMRMIAGDSSVNAQNLELWEFNMQQDFGDEDTLLQIRNTSYAFVDGDTRLRDVIRVNDELIAFTDATVAPGGANTATNVQFIHWPWNGAPSIIATVEYAGNSASINEALGSAETRDNQVILAQGNQSSDECNFGLLELVYPIAVTNSLLDSGVSVAYTDLKWDVANSSETLIPGGPVYVPTTTDGVTGSGYIVSSDQMQSQDDGIRFGRALTTGAFLIQRP